MATKLQKAENARLYYIQGKIQELGIRFPVAELSEKLKFSKGNVSEMLKGTRPISDTFFDKFCQEYNLDGIIKPAPAGDKLNRERALIKVLLHEVARLKAKDEGISFEKALEAMKQSTNLVLDDLDDL